MRITNRYTNEIIFEDRSIKSMATAINEAHRSGISLRMADFGRRGLSFAAESLSELDLTDCDFSGCDMSYCNLIGSILSRANLRGARLDSSIIAGADFISSNLELARMNLATATDANFNGAALYRSTASEATLTGTGVIYMQLGLWQAICTPDYSNVGCKRMRNSYWIEPDNYSKIVSMHPLASGWWHQYGEIFKAACRACEEHGWPRKQDASAESLP